MFCKVVYLSLFWLSKHLLALKADFQSTGDLTQPLALVSGVTHRETWVEKNKFSRPRPSDSRRTLQMSF